MQLGFVSAILPDLGLEDVVGFAAREGFSCVELMCWPPGAADRRYAGVCHIDVNRLTDQEAGRIRKLMNDSGVSISGLGYYPNPLHQEEEHRRQVNNHLRKVISAAPRLGVRIVNTFIGRNARQWRAYRADSVGPGCSAIPECPCRLFSTISQLGPALRRSSSSSTLRGSKLTRCWNLLHAASMHRFPSPLANIVSECRSSLTT